MHQPAWSGDWPIPRVVRLPGLRVRVKVVPHAEVEKRGSPYGLWIYDCPTSAVILISDAWPIELQRYILWHELGHAVHEGVDQMIEKFPEYVQTHAMRVLVGAKAAEIAAVEADVPA